jgi:hypothetical protein
MNKFSVNATDRQIRFFGERYFQLSPRGEAPTRDNFLFPEDAWILKYLMDLDEKILFSGSFADNLHMGKENFSVKDLDVQAGWQTLEFCLASENSRKFLEEFRKDRSLAPQIFNDDGLVRELGRGVMLRGEEYPRNLQMNFGRLFVELFLHNKDAPSEEIDYCGLRIRVISRDHRIKMIRSILEFNGHDNWIKNKKPQLRERLAGLEVSRP